MERMRNRQKTNREDINIKEKRKRNENRTQTDRKKKRKVSKCETGGRKRESSMGDGSGNVRLSRRVTVNPRDGPEKERKKKPK